MTLAPLDLPQGCRARGGSYHGRRRRLGGGTRTGRDDSHARPPKFPGTWDARTWAQYWSLQYAWRNGHQPWLASPLLVVRAWEPMLV